MPARDTEPSKRGGMVTWVDHCIVLYISGKIDCRGVIQGRDPEGNESRRPTPSADIPPLPHSYSTLVFLEQRWARNASQFRIERRRKGRKLEPSKIESTFGNRIGGPTECQRNAHVVFYGGVYPYPIPLPFLFLFFSRTRDGWEADFRDRN